MLTNQWTTIPIPDTWTPEASQTPPITSSQIPSPRMTPCIPPSTTPCLPPGMSPCPPLSTTPCPPSSQSLSQILYSSIQSRLQPAPSPHPPYDDPQQQPTLAETFRRVWSRLRTLFVPRQQLELVGLMRRTISHMTKTITQVRGVKVRRKLFLHVRSWSVR